MVIIYPLADEIAAGLITQPALELSFVKHRGQFKTFLQKTPGQLALAKSVC